MMRTFFILGVVTAMLFGPVAAMAADDCQEVTTTNRRHVNAGRAENNGLGCGDGGYYAVGSNDYLGRSGFTTTTLITTDGGQSYELGACEDDCVPETGDLCTDGLDNDCDGLVDAADAEDCPAACVPETGDLCTDGLDNDCDGLVDAADVEDCATGEDNDEDGYTSDNDCDDNNRFVNPGAMDFCGDEIDQDCSGSDTTCLPPPSCITNLDNWKVKYAPKNSDCMSCHTTCTPGGLNGIHSCTEGETWGAMNCSGCHRTAH